MEGILRLKKNSGGYRHYIELENGEHKDISCGSTLIVQFGKYESDELKPGKWLGGRYEASLSAPEPEAYLITGYSYPAGKQMTLNLPLGIRVRKV